jgi:hypothetical protein
MQAGAKGVLFGLHLSHFRWQPRLSRDEPRIAAAAPSTEHRSSTKLRRDHEVSKRWALRPKEDAFNQGGPQAPIELQEKTTKDVAVSIHTHYALAA